MYRQYYKETNQFFKRVMLVLGLVAALIMCVYKTCQNVILEKNGEYANGVIYRFSENGKNGRVKKLHCSYVVDGTVYKTWGRWYPRSDTLSVGDTIVLKYNKKKPVHSKTKRDLKLPVWKQ